MPSPRAPSSTPVGPKNPRAIASWQAKPTSLTARVAMKALGGWRVSATDISLAQPLPKVAAIQSVTRPASGASGRRIVTPASAMRASSAGAGTRRVRLTR